jgi:hypothetical protein
MMSSGSLSISLTASLHKESDKLRLLLTELGKSLFVENKLRYYKRILASTNRSLRNYDVDAISKTGMNLRSGLLPAGVEEMMEWNRLRNKKRLLEQMIQVARRLLNDFDEGGEIFLLRLEKDLMDFLDADDRMLEHAEPDFPDFPTEWHTQDVYLISDKIKHLKVRLGLLLKRLYTRIYRDLRRQIRFIMRLFLPQSDDDADVSNAVVSADSISLHNILNPSSWKKRKYSNA